MFRDLFEKAREMTPKSVKRIFAIIIGFTLLFFGIILLFTPGPAIVVIPLALLILSSEFAWARYWIQHLKRHVTKYNENLGKYFPDDNSDTSDIPK